MWPVMRNDLHLTSVTPLHALEPIRDVQQGCISDALLAITLRAHPVQDCPQMCISCSMQMGGLSFNLERHLPRQNDVK